MVDARLESHEGEFPQVEALLDLRGVGLYTAMVVVAELGEVGRFRSAKQVGDRAGLTARVRQSGEHGRPWGDHARGLAAAAVRSADASGKSLRGPMCPIPSPPPTRERLSRNDGGRDRSGDDRADKGHGVGEGHRVVIDHSHS
jgi:hypothetical protein